MIDQVKYLAIDGGGSKTHLVSCDANGDILQSIMNGASNHQSGSYKSDNLFEALGLFADSRIEVAAFTMSGWDFDYDQKKIKDAIDHAIAYHNISIKNIVTENDTYAVLKSGLQKEKDALVFIAGSGCMGLAISGDKIHRHYGYGFQTGEWGSGIEISEYALYRIFAAEQHREAPCPILSEKALRYFKLESIDELAKKITSGAINVLKIGNLLEVVYEAYCEGCETSKAILKKAGKEHAKSILSLMHYTNNTGPIILGGGVFQTFGILPGTLEHLKEHKAKFTEIRLVSSPPVYGAIKWALELNQLRSNSIEKEIKVEIIK